MSDWTPTTSDLRQLILTGFIDYPGAMSDTDLLAAFDRWLERERMASFNEGYECGYAGVCAPYGESSSDTGGDS